mgnify:CR=1 FL=1
MQAIILAAGMGKRLKELTSNATKCMVEVNGEMMIHKTLMHLEKLNLNKIVLVVGYEGQQLMDYVNSLGLKTPVEYGMEASVHMISEACEPGAAVFGGEGVEIHRLALKEFFPFTTCLKHVICEGVYNDLGELVDSTVHMWEDVEGGCVHITATVQNSKVSAPPAFIIDILKKDPNAKIVPNFLTEHEDFEASQWPVFLPKLYDLWKNHPDPSQNVQCCLEVEKTAEGWRYIKENGPVVL